MHLLALYIYSFSFQKTDIIMKNGFTHKNMARKFNTNYIEKPIF